MSINKVAISGNLTRDAEVRATQSGTYVISFCVAVNDRRQNQQTGQWEDAPNFVDCVMFDKSGNRQWMANAMRKGFKVFVEGSLRYSTWQDRDTGKNRSKLEVVARDIDASWPKKDQAQGYPPQQATQQYAQAAPQYQQPQAYQQQPQGYGQPVSAPQAPQPASYPPPQQCAPQQAPQPQPQQAAQPQATARPQQTQIARQEPERYQAPDVYDEDIPF